MTIQWFPGHMAKARREVTEKLKLIDIIFELVDARIPYSSRNPMIDEIIQHKPRIILLNKADIADREYTKQWIEYFNHQGMKALAINSQTGTGLKEIVNAAKELLNEKFARLKAKGVKPRPIRAMIVGIPNVGKSTLINRLANKNIAKTGNTPGVTKAQQWIKVGKELELLDTPGILWPKFEEEEVGLKLALTGAIKDTILNLQDVALYGLTFLEREYPERLKKRYQLQENPTSISMLYDHIGLLRGCLMAGGEINYDKVTEHIIKDIRGGKLGTLTFEKPKNVD
ncbi:ribosome biogenesis GTPase YlqF [Bacillus aquiflavi]|uniref:Ribosome biogenesis GTPase A n=1 Tax=Bacillus aquiflavi TaxID=2672567 RepID=A0A6B3VYY1_9BACI|nr:ribosome biogenesis GTPase YlqF [Bacillus aquiflavi]MBA4536206.1 ribosome biogenesis GTPase YlqF [Bacillus aquiflavi]NEY80574.1 ribosome biogenesis GTPase YlqF [Bacillus aquiflavi]UAC49393.1 ribosome biogenesis GTPase YlqF [Bacillus aquiflavi]